VVVVSAPFTVPYGDVFTGPVRLELTGTPALTDDPAGVVASTVAGSADDAAVDARADDGNAACPVDDAATAEPSAAEKPSWTGPTTTGAEEYGFAPSIVTAPTLTGDHPRSAMTRSAPPVL
jgi:hypothetical protein